MAHAVPDLWPKDIPVRVLTPAIVLRDQAARLKDRTDGLLIAEVQSATEADRASTEFAVERWVHRFEVVAPALSYRHQLFLAIHPLEMPYPVVVQSQYLPLNELGIDIPSATAFDQTEFIGLIGQILRSSGTRSVLESLIARINELTPEMAG